MILHRGSAPDPLGQFTQTPGRLARETQLPFSILRLLSVGISIFSVFGYAGVKLSSKYSFQTYVTTAHLNVTDRRTDRRLAVA